MSDGPLSSRRARRRALVGGAWLAAALVAAAPVAAAPPSAPVPALAPPAPAPAPLPAPAPGPPPAPAPAPPQPRPLLHTPRLVALGVDIDFRGSRVAPRARVVIERRLGGERWTRVAAVRADAAGRFRGSVRPHPARRRIRLRARVAGQPVSRISLVRARAVTLDAVGDVNLGDGPGGLIAARGAAAPWTNVGPTLRRADVAVANLECAVSLRGTPQVKEFVFRGRPSSLRAARTVGGLDVVTLANNHAADYGPTALFDTRRYATGFGLVPVGAGANAAAAARPRIVERLGLKIGFVGLSDINPPGFTAGPSSPGTARASAAAAAVHAARRRGADVVVVYYHWGIERTFQPTAQQQELARAALRAGAQVVLGAHPHVLQPIRRAGHRLIAYSLGNFVFSANSPGTERTGILQLQLARAGVVGAHFRRAHIVGSRPVLG